MKISILNDDGKEIKCMEIQQSDIDAAKRDAGDYNSEGKGVKGDIKAETIENSTDREGKMSRMFAMKKEHKGENEEHEDDYDDEQDVKKGKPMKQRRPGLF